MESNADTTDSVGTGEDLVRTLLSILIPVYNAGDRISGLLNALIGQRQEGVEVILLDDGSSDRSMAVIQEYRAGYPDYIRAYTRENRGALLTRRELFTYSVGEWIWVIDADDTISDTAVRRLLALTAGTDADLIMFDYSVSDGARIRQVSQLDAEDGSVYTGAGKAVLYRALVSGDRINSLWSKVFRRHCIDFDADYEQYGNIRRANDKFQLVPILTKAGKVLYVRQQLYTYHMVRGSLTHSFHDGIAPSLLKVCGRLDRYLDLWNLREELGTDFSCYVAEIVCMLAELFILGKARSPRALGCFIGKLAEDPLVARSLSMAGICEERIPRRRLFHLLREGSFKRAVLRVSLQQVKSALIALPGWILSAGRTR